MVSAFPIAGIALDSEQSARLYYSITYIKYSLPLLSIRCPLIVVYLQQIHRSQMATTQNHHNSFVAAIMNRCLVGGRMWSLRV